MSGFVSLAAGGAAGRAGHVSRRAGSIGGSIGHADHRLIRTTVAKLTEQRSHENVTATAVILYGALAGTD